MGSDEDRANALMRDIQNHRKSLDTYFSSIKEDKDFEAVLRLRKRIYRSIKLLSESVKKLMNILTIKKNLQNFPTQLETDLTEAVKKILIMDNQNEEKTLQTIKKDVNRSVIRISEFYNRLLGSSSKIGNVVGTYAEIEGRLYTITNKMKQLKSRAITDSTLVWAAFWLFVCVSIFIILRRLRIIRLICSVMYSFVVTIPRVVRYILFILSSWKKVNYQEVQIDIPTEL